MFIELIDVLRCTRPHEDTWLVAAFHDLVDRNVVAGLLSCPVCKARYPIVDGVAYFDVAVGSRPIPGRRLADGEDELAVRAAAFLNFTDGATLVLHGAWADGAAKLAGLGARVIALNADVGEADAVSRIRTAGGALPLAANSIDGIALDGIDSATIESAARALRPKGRLVALASSTLPDGMTEVARDAEWWIAERSAESVSAPVRLTRTPRSGST